MIEIIDMYQKHFPRECCGQVFKGPKSFMDHVLGQHERVGEDG